MKRKIIAVIGGNNAAKKHIEAAYKAGNEIARRGAVLVCGGLSGVMEASCRGAKKGGGITIGILPSKNGKTANKYVDIPVATGMGEARNVVIVNTADAFVAIDGKEGTLSELAFALKAGKPVAGIDTYDIPGIMKCAGPEEAVEKVFLKLEGA
ncbi:MAG TPA: TIGR00725 family protein [Candidatus Goldiibacteriota bacterium]|nr:TIGR00725 family protein [Candidatus Goldiibacteriota bacterium]HPN63884.1 TIGR00725 family protein [Candidatus Goldiibacteriota bacterium]HRQ42925.1 TIGR00725 family protein [Candidatus Goldiibacteriota bacterium]